jgi:hypothetical protein
VTVSAPPDELVTRAVFVAPASFVVPITTGSPAVPSAAPLHPSVTTTTAPTAPKRTASVPIDDLLVPKCPVSMGPVGRRGQRRRGKNGQVRGVDWLVTSSTRGCVASISMFEMGEASRRLRNVVKEPEPSIPANDNLALAA